MNYSPRYGQFRALLRKVREEAGLNQMALAQKLGKPQTFVSKSELGERRIDFLETLEFCKACGIAPEELVKRLERIAPTPKPTTRIKRKSPRRMGSDGRLSN